MQLLMSFFTVVGLIVLSYGLVRMFGWVAYKVTNDQKIDDLIEKNKFSFKKDMKFVDYKLMNKTGNTAWRTVVQAQRNLQKKAAV